MARVLARFDAGNGLSAYEDIEPKDKVFTQLCGLFSGRKDGLGLSKLVAARQMDAPNDPTVILWNADALFLTGDYAHAVSVLDGNRTAILAVRVGGLQTNLYRFRDLYIRSQVRLKNFVAARAEANLNPGAADVKDWWHIAIVECAAGNVADATQAMDAWLKDGVDEVDESDLEHDPDIGPALATPPFAAWRRDHALPATLPVQPIN
jgi:hypothetical protein